LRLSTAYHPQTDGQTERMNQTLEHYLRCFIDTAQITWPKLLPSAEFACNNAINITIGISPFEALRGYQADFHIDIEDDITKEKVPAATDRIHKLQRLREDLKNRWRKATEAQANQYNKRHQTLTFKAKDLVMLSTKNLRLKGSKKLLPTFIGPFRVLNAIGSQAYRLSLPTQYNRIHNVFHVSLLEPYKGKLKDELPMPELEDDDEWEVEEIKAKTMRNKESFYLVKWKGWPSEYNQWVSADDMEHAPKIVQKFEKSIKKASNKTL
ncbi:to reverse transcriptase, partial [Aspergillus sclerotialis]